MHLLAIHEQIEQKLKEQIQQGNYAKDGRLPTEHKLAQQYQVARMTIRKVLDSLMADGLIIKKQGKGTFVASKKKRILQKKGNIGYVLSDDISKANIDPYYYQLFIAIERVISRTSNNLLYQSDIQTGQNGNFKGFIEKIDGVILAGDVSATLASRFMATGLPTIVTENYLKNCSYVFADYEDGAFRAIRYLYELGHRRIGILSSNPKVFPGNLRMMGIKKAIKDLQLDQSSFSIEYTPIDLNSSRQATLRLLSSRPRPTALFIFEDAFIAGVLQALSEQQLKVPKDISLLSGDGTKPAGNVYPFSTPLLLTAFVADLEKIGNTTVTKLLENIDNTINKVQIKIPQVFMEYGSCTEIGPKTIKNLKTKTKVHSYSIGG